jgi:glycosyltransferase involved in cell wall biosynthesis
MILNKPSQSLDYSQAFLESAANEVDQAMKLSVVIPTYNRCGLLQRVLRGLCEQLASSLLEEVLVVSDGSTDGTPGVVSQFADRLPVRLIEQDKRGVSAARNLGVAQARAPVVLFLDDDVVPAANLIAEHAAFHRRSHELEAVMLGYVTWHPEIAVTPFMRWYGEYGGLYGFSRLRSGQVADRRFLYTCNLSLKTEFFLRNGGFNEALTVMEDHELGYRLSRAGMKMTFLRQAVGYHYQAFRFEDACQRLSRYSSGLPAFLATDAGGLMLAARERPSFRLADMGVRALGPALRIMRPMVDLNIQLPNAVYRLFYWYFATYQSFWGPARRALAARKSAGVQT